MRVAVYLPLLLPILAAVSARWLAGRLHPRTATGLLTATALGLAAASGFALTALAATAIGQIPLLAALGDWSAGVLRRDDPASLSLALAACVVLAAALAGAARAVIRRTRALVHAAQLARRLPATDRDGRLVVVDDPAPYAYALPGLPGRIVVSTGMFDALDDRERTVLLAHERAHLAFGHHLFLAAAHLAAATNPLLRPVATAVGYTTERWADEHAAQTVGDRRLVARTIGKAALLTHHHTNTPSLALAMTPSVLDRVRGAGPVPRRVAALLATPPRRRRLLLMVALGMLALAATASLETARDLETLFEIARTTPDKAGVHQHSTTTPLSGYASALPRPMRSTLSSGPANLVITMLALPSRRRRVDASNRAAEAAASGPPWAAAKTSGGWQWQDVG